LDEGGKALPLTAEELKLQLKRICDEAESKLDPHNNYYFQAVGSS